MRLSKLPAAALLAQACLSTPLFAEGKSIIVLHASGSMWGQIDGRPKREIARAALGTVLSGLDPATEIGLMAYAHREEGRCAGIELAVLPGPGTATSILDAHGGGDELRSGHRSCRGAGRTRRRNSGRRLRHFAPDPA